MNTVLYNVYLTGGRDQNSSQATALTQLTLLLSHTWIVFRLLIVQTWDKHSRVYILVSNPMYHPDSS